MSKIKQSDLREKLGLGESKRVSEGNGLTLIITGTQKGTSYKFQHRCTFARKRIEKILKTKDLNEARQIAAERMSRINSGKHPDINQSSGLMFSSVADEWLKQQKLGQSSMQHFTCYVDRLKTSFEDYAVQKMDEKLCHEVLTGMAEKYGTWAAKKTLSVLSRIMQYAEIIYSVKMPDIRRMQFLFKAPSVKHRESLTEGNLDDNIIHIFLSIREKTKQNDHIVMYYLAFLLLLRLQEINDIKISNINLIDKVLLIEKTKTLEDGIKIPITDELERVLKYFMKKSTNRWLLSSSKSTSGKFYLKQLSAKLRECDIGQSFHGIRSIGRLWMHQNGIPFEVAESCLTHIVGSAVTRAYLRTDYYEERRQAMEKWHNYLHELLHDIVILD